MFYGKYRILYRDSQKFIKSFKHLDNARFCLFNCKVAEKVMKGISADQKFAFTNALTKFEEAYFGLQLCYFYNSIDFSV